MNRDGNRDGLPLPAEDEPAAVERIDGKSRLVFIADHAGARIPRALNGLGLAGDDLARHIAVDIGAARLTRALAAAFDASAVLARYSRLVIDCNRRLDEASLIPEVSDGSPIPGNRGLSARDREARIDGLYHPYHRAVDLALDTVLKRGETPVLIAVHSFTPRLRGGAPRPWHAGVLWNRDDRIAKPLLAALSREPGLCVGDNLPYSGFDGLTHTTDIHALEKGHPHVELEIRQDLISDDAGIRRFAEIVERALRAVLERGQPIW